MLTKNNDLGNEYKFMETNEVLELTRQSRVGLYEAIKNEGFPKPIQMTGRKNLYRLSEVLAWIDSRQPKINTQQHHYNRKREI